MTLTEETFISGDTETKNEVEYIMRLIDGFARIINTSIVSWVTEFLPCVIAYGCCGTLDHADKFKKESDAMKYLVDAVYRIVECAKDDVEVNEDVANGISLKIEINNNSISGGIEIKFVHEGRVYEEVRIIPVCFL